MNALSIAPVSRAINLRPREFRVAVACIAVSIGLHAAFLLVARVGSFNEGFSDTPASGGVEVRLRAAEPIVLALVASSESAWQPMQPIKRTLRTSQPYPSMLEFRPVDIPRRGFDESLFLPLAKLTLPPAPLATLAVSYPEGTGVTGTVTARLTLFIDEDGNVARVVVGSAELPDAFVQAAKDAFEPAKFRPGQIDGTPVKVRMVVDVEFQDRGEKRPKRSREKTSLDAGRRFPT